MASPMQVATATVVRWTEGQPEPSSHNVKAINQQLGSAPRI